MFQENLLTGLFFWLVLGLIHGLELFILRWGHFFLFFCCILGIDPEMLNMGLMGYNGVLCALALGGKTWKKLCMGFMFSLAVRCIAVCRDQVGNYYSDCTFCTICMDDNDNAESGEYKR